MDDNVCMIDRKIQPYGVCMKTEQVAAISNEMNKTQIVLQCEPVDSNFGPPLLDECPGLFSISSCCNTPNYCNGVDGDDAPNSTDSYITYIDDTTNGNIEKWCLAIVCVTVGIISLIVAGTIWTKRKKTSSPSNNMKLMKDTNKEDDQLLTK